MHSLAQFSVFSFQLLQVSIVPHINRTRPPKHIPLNFPLAKGVF